MKFFIPFIFLLCSSYAEIIELTTDTQEEWEKQREHATEVKIDNGMLSPTKKSAYYKSRVQSFQGKHKPLSIEISQSPIWQNWTASSNIGPDNLGDSPIFIQLGPQNYWMFGRYGGAKKDKGEGGFQAEKAQLEGFDIPLLTTPWKNQFKAPGGLKPHQGGYHAWQSRDMKNWVHHGPVSNKKSRWMTNAEFVDGKAYFYYDFPNDQDPHLIIDSDLTDGLLGEMVGMAFKDPSHGSDAGVIRSEDGRFHLIVENWDPIMAQSRSWDSPLASHAVSDDGRTFTEVAPAVDYRTKPTGEIGTYKHPHWKSEDPANYKTSTAEYQIHHPEQEAYGDWAAIAIGGQYYLFGDYDPAGDEHHEKGKKKMSVCWFTSSSIDSPFAFCDHIGQGHPDPDIIFAEGQFYLATQMKTDYVSPGPWVESVEVRVGVDTTNDKKIDTWTEWTPIKELYDYREGFSKQVAKTPAKLDLVELPEGYAFQYELRLKDTTENKSKPIIDKVKLSLKGIK